MMSDALGSLVLIPVFIGFLVVVDETLPHIQEWRKARFEREPCTIGRVDAVTKKREVHALRPEFIPWHTRAIRLRCRWCGASRLFVYSLHFWPPK